MNQLYRLVRYNYVSLNLYWLSSQFNLNLTVLLNRSCKDGTTRFCYTEKSYANGTNAYVDLDWNMKLRDIYNFESGAFTITNRNLYQFVCIMRTMRLWLTDVKHNELFMIDKKNNIYRCNPAYKPLVTINSYNEKLELVPSIMVTDIGDHIPGVQIIINNGSSSTFVNVQDFLNFDLFIQQLNPTMMAMQLLTMFNGGHMDDDQSSISTAHKIQQQQTSKHSKERQGFLSMAGATKRNDS